MNIVVINNRITAKNIPTNVPNLVPSTIGDLIEKPPFPIFKIYDKHFSHLHSSKIRKDVINMLQVK